VDDQFSIGIELEKPPDEIKSKEDAQKVASFAAHDNEIGNLVVEVMEKVGIEGYIIVEVSGSVEYGIECIEGYRFDSGYMSSDFVTNSERMEAVMNDPYILVTRVVNDILPVLEKIPRRAKSLVFIAGEVGGEALNTLVGSNLRGKLKCLAVEVPGLGDRRKAALEDIAILTGGTVIGAEVAPKLNAVTVGDLGRARRVVSTTKETTILLGRGSEEAIMARIKQIKAQIKESTSESDREELRMRLAKLIGGLAILKVRSPSEKRQAEDAISAVKVAVEKTK